MDFLRFAVVSRHEKQPIPNLKALKMTFFICLIEVKSVFLSITKTNLKSHTRAKLSIIHQQEFCLENHVKLDIKPELVALSILPKKSSKFC